MSHNAPKATELTCILINNDGVAHLQLFIPERLMIELKAWKIISL